MKLINTVSIASRLFKKKNADPLFKVGVNEMPIRSTHDDMATRHAINGAGLLIPLGVNTIVTKYPSNQL